jgi:ELWxxDGT repeat protein
MKQKLPSTLIALTILLLMSGVAIGQPKFVSEIPTSSKNFDVVGGKIYFSAGDNLYSATSTSPAVLVKTTGQEILKISEFTLGANFFFVTQNGSGQSLWRSDGTAANTVSIATYNQITPLLVYHSNLFLKINSSANGNELWKVDAAFNVTILKDINPGTANGFNGYEGSLIEHNNLLYFFGVSGTGQDLWRSDGTTAGTVLSVDLDNMDEVEFVVGPSYSYLTSVNDVMFFTLEYEAPEWGEKMAELWKTDGSSGGTSMVKRFPNGYSYNFFTDLIEFKGKLYFFHNIDDPIYTRFSVSDGTEAGTYNISLSSIDGGPQELMSAETHLVFYANSQSFNSPIEKWDGTTGTEVHEFALYNSEHRSAIDLTTTPGRAFFLDDYTDYYGGASELWQADLVSGVTRPLAQIYGASFSGSRNITEDGASIYFTRLVAGKMSLWHYNPDAPPMLSECGADGYIEREKWNNVTGYAISTIPTSTQPGSINLLSNFTSAQNDGDNYGARVRGYVCAPETGNYVFYISSDDNSELWLSTDDDPANKRLIASSKWTNYNEWGKYPSQQSIEIPLVKGNKYYIEALHKEAAGADHLSVGWKLPNGTIERPIAGRRLSRFDRNQPPLVTIYQPEENTTFTAPASVTITAFARDPNGQIARVLFFNSGTLLFEDTTYPYSYTWQNVPAGTYIIEARAVDTEGYVGSDFQMLTVSPGCSGTGNIFQEIWVNASGTDVRTFDFSTRPNGGSRSFTSFETTQYYSNNYASRMRGYVCVPQTGAYTFWISSDDYSQLYLSTDESEANTQLIAWVYGATQFRNYDKYPSQKSVQITLQAGRKYYIEARHKEGTGNDFVSVGWQLPDGTIERPIAGNRLIAIQPAQDKPTNITIISPQPNQNFTSSSVNISADITDADGIEEVRFDVLYGSSSTRLATFTEPPYQFNWTNVPSGSYQLNVSADDTRNGTTVKIVFFSVENSPCVGAGKIVREIWTGIPGTSVSAIPLSSTPNRTVELTSFATPNYYGNDYGSRIRGYVCAPASGSYTFWISGDDNSELWLADSDDPATKQRIAYVSGATSVNQWTKYSTQEGRVNLVQGQRYYIEVLHKEGNGADHVEVGWQIPNGALERPIPGNRLIPYDQSTSARMFATERIVDSDEGERISIYPNPVISGNQIRIAVPDGVSSEVRVDIVSLTGVDVQSETQNDVSGEMTVNLKPSVSPGMYFVRVFSNKKRWWNKVQVK